MQYHYHVVYYFSTDDGYNGNGSISISCDHKMEYGSDIREAVEYIKSKTPNINKAVIINIIPLKGFDR